jgi:hypothetical protein
MARDYFIPHVMLCIKAENVERLWQRAISPLKAQKTDHAGLSEGRANIPDKQVLHIRIARTERSRPCRLQRAAGV